MVNSHNFLSSSLIRFDSHTLFFLLYNIVGLTVSYLEKNHSIKRDFKNKNLLAVINCSNS